jgi:hypothetical protein
MLAAMRLRHALLAGTCLLLCTLVAAASPSPRETRAQAAARWQSQGLQPLRTRGLDLLYVRPGLRLSTVAVKVAPVAVEMREDWQRASPELAHARVRPREVQRLKDEVALIVADELHRELAGVRAGADAGAPVLEARVQDLYLNAPDLMLAPATRHYVRSFGDMVLVAELREGRGGPLLLGTWDHRPARDFPTLRLATRVENAIEVRAAARAWARQLRRELDRLAGGR